MIFFKTVEYQEWYHQQTAKTQFIIEARLSRILDEDHWGQINRFDDLIELKWISGMRIYTAKINQKLIVILFGGNKNGQNKDIKKAKKILEKIRCSHFN